MDRYGGSRFLGVAGKKNSVLAELDHLIKRKGGETKVAEKGSLFKIDKKNLSLLFPEPVSYQLV